VLTPYNNNNHKHDKRLRAENVYRGAAIFEIFQKF
jgi:hypothetical protein